MVKNFKFHNMQHIKFFIAVFTIFILAWSGCANEQKEQLQTKNLGELQFEVTGNPDAQPHFEEGLLLLHSFEFEDARAAFQKAREIDPDFAMAYWGEAMTHNHPLWRNQDYEKGRAVLDSAGTRIEAILAEKGTEIERDLWQSIKTLYADEGDKTSRDKAYSEYLESLYKKYPSSHEIAAFYALSVLGAVPVGRDEKAYGLSATIAKGILEENPKHPGALHYLIHSYDDPAHAQLALNAAYSYSKVAPDAAHALHMPSHIFVALGMWDEVVSSNIAAWEASVNRMQRLDLDNDALNYHSYHWLLYGYLQQGKKEAAQGILEKTMVYIDTLPSKRARSHLVDMKGTYLAETGDWNGEFSNFEVNLDDLNITARAAYQFMNGMSAYTENDQEKLKSVISAMRTERETSAMFITNGGAPMCSSGSSRFEPNQLDIDQAHIFEMELLALQANMNNNQKTAEKWFQAACELQENTSYSYGPPVIMIPSFELYANWLLEQNRPKEALIQFEKAEERGPKRVSILKGKIKAYQMVNEAENEMLIKKTLSEIWKEADPALKVEVLGKEQLSERAM